MDEDIRLLSQEYGSLKKENMNERLEACLQSIKNSKKRTFSQAIGQQDSGSRAFLQKEENNKKRLRKNEDQNKFLLSRYVPGEQWSKETIVELATQLGLKPSQIYKWHWDMVRKSKEFAESYSDGPDQ